MDEEYAVKIIRQVVCKILESKRIDYINYSCSSILVDVFISHIRNIAFKAHKNSELTGRTISNVVDVLQVQFDENITINKLLITSKFIDTKLKPVNIGRYPHYTAVIKSSTNMATLKSMLNEKVPQSNADKSASSTNTKDQKKLYNLYNKRFQIEDQQSIPPHLPIFPAAYLGKIEYKPTGSVSNSHTQIRSRPYSNGTKNTEIKGGVKRKSCYNSNIQEVLLALQKTKKNK